MVVGPRYELSPAAVRVDESLARIDQSLNWLHYFMPTNIAAARKAFEEGGRRALPPLEYDVVDIDLDDIRRELFSLPVHDIDDPFIEVLLVEKQREIDAQIELIRMRNREGIALASIDLFGAVGDRMRSRAEQILETVPDAKDPDLDCDCDEFLEAAEGEFARLSDRGTHFVQRAIINANEGTGLFTEDGNLNIPRDFRVARSRIAPLIQHEVGTHSVTRHNGLRQPLTTLSMGLADYDVLQEGLAVLGEYLTGYLPPRRLRMLAARVIAADMRVHEKSDGEIYAAMREQCGLGDDDAFDTMLRAARGGCFTKDALYLKGLVELVAYLHHGGDYEILFLGKFSLKQLPTLEKLVDRGLLHPPDLLPTYLDGAAARERLEAVRRAEIVDLYQESPAL
ncbi:tyrosine/phenylalanine carboxypeptidase domain-containing protein [Sphingomicrobium arenosum]|uniref:tyrosine/phenylalanine carboxypeptidase domain-containing protein n=1 Tax=Sphingomicrobium arenosum TaxID=2233861 RepID=UPI00223EE127|nr:tyrosine/phenylalanine carboxypeptidase domain-containing protein [Sphingomicrobium arenosum]